MEKKTENDGSNLTLVASCEWVWKEKTASRLVQRWQLRAKHCAPTLHSAKVTVKSSSQTLMGKKPNSAWPNAVSIKLMQSKSVKEKKKSRNQQSQKLQMMDLVQQYSIQMDSVQHSIFAFMVNMRLNTIDSCTDSDRSLSMQALFIRSIMECQQNKGQKGCELFFLQSKSLSMCGIWGIKVFHFL